MKLAVLLPASTETPSRRRVVSVAVSTAGDITLPVLESGPAVEETRLGRAVLARAPEAEMVAIVLANVDAQHLAAGIRAATSWKYDAVATALGLPGIEYLDAMNAYTEQAAQAGTVVVAPTMAIRAAVPGVCRHVVTVLTALGEQPEGYRYLDRAAVCDEYHPETALEAWVVSQVLGDSSEHGADIAVGHMAGEVMALRSQSPDADVATVLSMLREP